MEMLVKMAEVLVKIAVMMMVATAAFRRHRKRGAPSSSSLTSSLHGRRVSPLVLGLHGMGGARAPPRLDLSLYLSLFLRSVLLPFHRFVYIYMEIHNSDWTETFAKIFS